MAYRPTFAIDSIGEDRPRAIDLAMRAMGHLLHALVAIDIDYLVAFPDQFVPLYDAGIVYDRMEPEPGSACGDDDWQDIVHVYAARLGDCEDLACIRVAECRVRWGILGVQPYVTLHRGGDAAGPRHLYHIMVEWPETLPGRMMYPATVHRRDGRLVECPSEVLGMKGAA